MPSILITPAQARMARALVGQGLREIAKDAKVGINTLARFEQDDRGATSTETALKIAQLYQSKGVEFLEGDGVRRCQQAA